MALRISPTVDYAFKRLFGDPRHSAVLVHPLNSVFEGQFVVRDVEILTPFLENATGSHTSKIFLRFRRRQVGGRGARGDLGR
ncbi:MAG: hypothetical protein FJ297_18735 [Planctomycetes bacterium]|nr:hypothetical protein [Planctomycetota bacterium]